jgi:hypothetical protein
VTDVYEDPMPEDQLVERLHSLLAQALQRSRPQPFDSPVTVAEIYQDLVPYRNVRPALGFQMNADYEHTLLRLLAGEGGRARLEPAEARHELRAELDTPNPNVGLFRKFAACDVWVTPGLSLPVSVPAGAAAEAAVDIARAAPELPDEIMRPAPEPPAAEPVRRPWDAGREARSVDADLAEWDASLPELILEDVVPTEPAAAQAPPEPAPVSAPVETSHQPEATAMFEAAASPVAGVAAHTGSCAFCASDLPLGRHVKFCPFCGADQSMQPCTACAEPLEPGWRFCIACGTRQDA